MKTKYRRRTTPRIVAIPPGFKNSVETTTFHQDNARRLADFLEKLPRASLYMPEYISELDPFDCGTRACALGWAVLSGEIPGLGWTYESPVDENDPDVGRYELGGLVTPVVNGQVYDFHEAGDELFGPYVNSRVFNITSRAVELSEVVGELRHFANHPNPAKLPGYSFLLLG